MKKSLKKNLTQISAISFGAAMLIACGDNDGSNSSKDDANQLVECHGVGSNADGIIAMPKKLCDKLDASKQVPIKTSDYVPCFGVSAAGKNDCATNTTSCGGSAKEPRQADAWVSLPKSICENLKGATVGEDKDGKKSR